MNRWYIYQHSGWPDLTWDSDTLNDILGPVRFHEGLLLGQMRSLGFDTRSEAVLLTVTSDVVTTSAIEGEKLDPRQVRSSIARRLGMDAGGRSTSYLLPDKDDKIQQ